jgi:hypothetical protein
MRGPLITLNQRPSGHALFSRHPREGGDPTSNTMHVARKLDSVSRLRCRSGLHGITMNLIVGAKS